MVVAAGDMETVIEDTKMRLWVGFLSDELFNAVDMSLLEFDSDVFFEVNGTAGFLPFGQSLVDVANEHYAFFSAGEEGGPAGSSPGRGDAGSDEMSSRLERIELMMADLQENWTHHMERKGFLEADGKTSPSTLRQPKAKSLPPSRPTRDGALRKPSVAAGTLDQSLVAAATQAGVGTDTLDEVARLMSKNVKAQKVKDMSPGLQPDPFVRRRRDRGARARHARRLWFGARCWRPYGTGSHQLGGDREDHERRQEEEADVQDREHVGGLWSFFERDGDCGIWQAVCSRAQSFETDVVEPPRGALQPFGAPDDGGPHVADSGSRDAHPRSFLEGLGRTSIADRCLQGECTLRLGSCRRIGLPGKGTGPSCSSSLEHLAPPDRPSSLRQRKLDAGLGTLPGTPPAFFVPPAALTSGRGRTAVQSAARSEVGRSGYGISTGTGRFPVQAEEPRQEDQERRRGGRKGLPEIQVQADSQSQGVP